MSISDLLLAAIYGMVIYGFAVFVDALIRERQQAQQEKDKQ